MAKKTGNESSHRDTAADAIRTRAARIEQSRKERRQAVWFGLGMFGLVGWAIAVPTLAGVALGLWLDRALPAPFSWTIALLMAGVMLGSWNAWRWIHREGGND